MNKRRLMLLLLVFSLSIPLALAQSRGTIVLNFKNESLSSALKRLEKASDYKIMFTYNEVESYKVNASVHTSSFEEALRTVIGNYPLNYKIEGKIVTVKLAHKTTPDRERTINGTVVDEIGEPLPGATITPHTESAFTQSAVITDAEGQFRITVGSDVQRLEVSYIGFGTQFVNLTGSNSYTITMREDAHRLDNVVVTGIFPKRKDAYTGAVTTITSEELKNFGNKNLITSIGNIDPAFNILTNNELGSNPNRLPEIQIRGNANLPALDDLQDNTKTDLNTPLIVLDGFEISLERLMDLNDDDVESITLLKDGSATAIYGSRGANGVVVISRKAPQVGRLKLSYNGSLNIEAPDLTDYHLLNAADKLELERRAGYYDMVDPQRDFNYKNKYASILKDVQRGVDTDWMALPLRTGVGQRHNMRIEGGDASFRYSASLQYNGVTGVMKGSNRNTFNGGINLTYRHQKLIFNNDLNIGYTKSKESPYGTFSQYTRLNPYWRPYDDNGEIIKMFDNDVNFWGTYSNLPTNPLYNATLRQKNSTNYTNITNNFAIEWRPFAGFIARGSLGLTWQDTESDNYKSAKHTDFEKDLYQTADGALRKGSYNYSTGKLMNYEAALTVSYTHLFAKKHQLYTGLNANIISRNSRNYYIQAEGFPDEDMDFLPSALQYMKDGKPSGSEAKMRSVGLVGSVNYSYDNRYYTDLAYRLDGSSQFGSDRRFAPFFSAGIGWNLHNEKFLKDSKLFNLLKLRASFGQTGSQNFNVYQAIATYSYYMSDRYNQWLGAYQMALENKNLEWQKTNKWNAGLEVSMLDSRINLVADIYLEKTSNLLSSLDLPLSNGFTSYVENVGKVENKGFEVKATVFIIKNTKNRLFWSITGSMMHNKDKVIALSQAMKDEYAKLLLTRGITPNRVIREGESQYTIYAVPSLGIDPSNGLEIYMKQNGEPTYTWDAADRVPCGVSLPKYKGNISSMLRWHDFTANISLGYRTGGQLYNQTLATRIENADKQYNVDERVFTDRWQQVGDRTFFKGLTNESATYATTRFVQNERTLTCQNIHLSYELRNKPWLTRWLGMQSAALSADLSDLFYISTIKQERGLDYPYSRRFSFTLSMNF